MKKLLLIVLYIASTTCFAKGGASEGGEASASVASTVAMSSAINASVQAQEAARQEQLTQQAALVANDKSDYATGMLQCRADWHDTPEGYLYDGCEDGRDIVSVNDYFQKYAPKTAKKITMTIFDGDNNKIYIYFN